MTNFDILNHNSNLTSEMVVPNITLDKSGNVNFQVECNFIETVSMVSYTNKIFYEKNIIILGNVISENDKENHIVNHYICYFDPMVYYENTPLKVREKEI